MHYTFLLCVKLWEIIFSATFFFSLFRKLEQQLDFHTFGNTASIMERVTVLVTGDNNVALSSFGMHIFKLNMSLVLEAF